MPSNEEIYEFLTKISKKQDKLLNLMTKIAKTLHLLPVTEKEERDIQITQRRNLTQAAKVNDDLNDMENKIDPNVEEILFPTRKDVFNDVLGDDFLGGM